MRRGLTFVELLLAVAVFAILLVGLSSHLQGSVVAWRRVTSTTEELQRIRVTMERLRSDLANAFVFDSSVAWSPPPTFQSDHLSCYTLLMSHTRDVPDEVRFITYAREAREGKTVLVRTIQTPEQAHATPPGPGAQEVFLEDVEAFGIRYGEWPQGAPELAWRTDWTNLQAMPYLVELTVTLEEGATAPREIRQVFVIPTGSLTP